MLARTTLVDLRNAIEAIAREVLNERGGEASNEEILNRLKERKAKEIEFLNDKLVNITLTKLLNDVGGRKRSKTMGRDDLDLFRDYPDVPQRIAIARGTKRDISTLTVSQAEIWIENHDIQREDRKRKAIKCMIEDCKYHQKSADETLAVILARMIKKGRMI